MDKIIHSLKSFRYTKEISKILSRIEPTMKNTLDLSEIFKELYKNDMISEADFVAMETKMMLHRCTRLLEHHVKGIDCGIYLFDEKEQKLWNASISKVSQHYNDYSQGLSTVNDIQDGDDIPVYGKEIVAISNVEKGEDIVSLNHKTDLLKAGYKAVCCIPIQYNDKMVGHTVVFSENIREFTIHEINMFSKGNEMIEEQLARVKSHLLSVIKQTD